MFYTGSSGRVEFTGLVPGDFTLRVVAVDPLISDRLNPDRRAIARNRLWVHGDDVFCVTHLKNDGVTVNQNTMTIDFYSTGDPTGFLCSFDRGEFFECKFLLSLSLSLSLSNQVIKKKLRVVLWLNIKGCLWFLKPHKM